MAKLQQAISNALPREAPGTVTLQPNVWVSDWEQRPRDPVVLGLRLLGARDKQAILKHAREHVQNQGAESDDAFEAWQLAKLRFLVAFAICDPNDSTKPSSVLEHPIEQVFAHVTEAGARYIFDAWQRVEIEKAPAFAEATDDETSELFELLSSGALEALGESDRSAALRHIKFARDLLAE